MAVSISSHEPYGSSKNGTSPSISSGDVQSEFQNFSEGILSISSYCSDSLVESLESTTRSAEVEISVSSFIESEFRHVSLSLTDKMSLSEENSNCMFGNSETQVPIDNVFRSKFSHISFEGDNEISSLGYNVENESLHHRVSDVSSMDESLHKYIGPSKKIKFHMDRRFSSYGRRRKAFLLSTSQLKDTIRVACCGNGCLKKFGVSKLKYLRTYYLSLNREEQEVYLTTALKPDIKDQIEYSLGHNIVCRYAFKHAHSIGNSRLARLHKRLLKDASIYSPRQVRQVGPVGNLAMSWMESYFNSHAEIMPNTGKWHLSDNFTRREVYTMYRDEMSIGHEQFTSYSHFTRLWKHYFNNVTIPKKVRMGICNVCASLKAQRQHTKSNVDKVMVNEALKIHREQQAEERAKLTKHRKKCLKNHGNYIGIVIDGMDQKKTQLPHFRRIPKDIKEDTFVQIHLVGALIYHQKLQARVFLTYPNIRNDPNLTITILHHIITTWEGALPKVLYLQLDNTARENKNQVLLAYLNMLVEKELFSKIKVGFLLVGHTHDHIDQMFSVFSKRLGCEDAFTLPKLMSIISEAYTPRPMVIHLRQTFDFRKFVHGSCHEEKCISQLNDLSFQHQFLIVKREGKTLLFGKQLSSSATWLPEDGLLFLTFIPNRAIVAALQNPLELHYLLEQCRKQNINVDWDKCIREKQILIEKAKIYAGNGDLDWWNEFFHDQESILNSVRNENTDLIAPFFWPENIGVVITNEVFSIPTDIQHMVHAPSREMYLGARKSRLKQAELLNLWKGDVQEIKVGTMAAVLAEDDPLKHPFWLCKVVDLARAETDEIISITVHWFRTEHHDAYLGKYVPEMIANQFRKRKRNATKNQPHTSILVLQEVDIIVYDFELTSAGHIRKATKEIICQRLPCKINDDGVGTSSRRTRKDMADNLGLHRDEDNVLVDINEEDGSSTSSPSDDGVDDIETGGIDTDEDIGFDSRSKKM